MGLDVETMLTGEPLEYRLRARIMQRAEELKQVHDDSLAVAIINRLAEAMEKGKSKS